MRYEDWNNGLNQIDMSFIEEYIDEKRKYKKKKDFKALIGRISAAAACIAVILTVIIAPTQISTFTPPAYEDAIYTAEEIAYIMGGFEKYNGLTNAYTTIAVPDVKYLYIDPLTDSEYADIYELSNKKASLDESEMKKFIDGFLPKLTFALSSGTIAKKYEINRRVIMNEEYLQSYISISDYKFTIVQNLKTSYINMLGRQNIYINGKMIQIDQTKSDEEILESLEPIKKDLFDIFGVNYSGVEITRRFDETSKTGAEWINIRFYDEDAYNLYKKISYRNSNYKYMVTDYIEIEFDNMLNYAGDIVSKDVLQIARIEYHVNRTENYKKVGEAKLLSLSDAENLLFNGYVFGGHSCPWCMMLQDKISFRGYDYVGMEYLFGYTNSKEEHYVGIPFYAFYKEIGTAENGNIIYAKTYVPAIEVSGLQEYFESQKANHK